MAPEVAPIRAKWPGAMTDRERFIRQMHFQGVDRCFNWEFGYWEELFRDWPLFRENHIRSNDDANRFFGLDRLENFYNEVFGVPTFVHPAFEPVVLGETETLETRVNYMGVVSSYFKSGATGHSQILCSSIKTPDDWRRIKAERLGLDDPARRLDVERVRKLLPAYEGVPLGIYIGSLVGLVRQMLTLEGFVYACADHPEMVEDMVESCCLLMENAIDQLLPAVPAVIVNCYENICCRNGPVVPLGFFRDVLVPRYKRLHKKIQAHGIDLWAVGCDGDVRPLLPFFLDCGINTLAPCEVQGCAHPAELLDMYPGALRIMGGVDKIRIARGKEAIDAYLGSLGKHVARGGFIPFIDHDWPPSISVEGYLYYLDAKRRLFGG